MGERNHGLHCEAAIEHTLTEMVRPVPTTESTSAAEFSQIFVEHVVKLHGVPEHVVSDRGSQFNSIFWASVCKLLRMNRAVSSAYHPESNGQTERTNRVVEEMLVCNQQLVHGIHAEHAVLLELWAAPIDSHIGGLA
eukprot:189605-Pelagomonas_calceolata.AAC.1